MINPVAFTIGSFSVHWYGIAYIFGLFLTVYIVWLLNKKQQVFKNLDQIFDLLFWIFIGGVVIGGRLGYVLFYNLPYYLEHPGKILAVWDGGMAFHGALIGTILVGFIWLKKHRLPFLKAFDLLVIPAALAQGIGRLANFVNRELVGRPIENPSFKWMGVDFGDGILRYPSQLFQFLSGVLLFLILLWIFKKKPRVGLITFSYLTLHGLFRFITEFWRQPDPQLDFVLGPLTMGQLLALLFFAVGIGGFYRIWGRARGA